jgi:hypothetical protein
MPLVAVIKNPTYLVLIGVIGAFGPAIGAIAISGFLHPESSGIPYLKRWGVFSILFCVILPFALFWPLLKGNLLIAVLFHASIDAFPQILPAQTAGASFVFDLLLVVWAVIVIVSDKMWKRRPVSPAVHSPDG